MSRLPALGLGTWQNTDPETCIESIHSALETGYRHIDTAQYYGNEELIGKALETADIARDELFVATKVHAEKFGLAYDEVIEGLEVSLDRLGLDYLDLLYVHWPIGNYDAAETMSAFDELVDRELINHVGVSNFSVELLDKARDNLDSDLFAHQAEMHPLLPQTELVKHAQRYDYNMVAYSPLARGNVFDIDAIQDVAAKHEISEAQVSLAWLFSKENVHAIPKASSENHIRDNFGALDVTLDAEDIERIGGIDRTERFIEREGAPWLLD